MTRFPTYLVCSLLTFSLLTSCGRDQGHAKSDLVKMNYQFQPEDFIRAARAGDEKAVGLFLNGGMDVNAKDDQGNTALIGAAENNAVKIVKLLIKSNADQSQKNKEGWTAFMKAIYGNRVEAVELLADNSREDVNRGLLLASLLGHTDTARILIEKGAEIDTTSPDGTTPLAYAKKNDNAALEKLLLEAGAENVEKHEVVGATPLATAPTPAPSPATAETLFAREALLKDPKTIRNSPEEAWWKKYGLDLDDPAVFTQDGDNDGYTNSEEFLADSSPIDPSDHPPAAEKLTWESYHRESMPWYLEKVAGNTATLGNSEGETSTVMEGDTLGDWKITSVSERRSVDKEGHPYDGSAVRATTSSGKKIRLVPGIRRPSGDSYAEVKIPFSDETQRLHAGDEFSLPNDGARKYQVLDLREDQVVLKEAKTGQTFTIAK